MAIPTSARASAGASLIPSPVMMTGARRCSRRTTSSLPAGVSSASTSSTPVSAPTASAASARSPVARTIRVMPPRRIARIVAGHRAGSGPQAAARPPAAVDRDEHRQRAVQPGPPAAALTHGGSPAAPAHPARPSLTTRPPTVPAMPWPGYLGHGLGQDQRAAALGRRPHDGGRQDVPGHLVQRGRQAQDLLRPAAVPAETTAVTAGCPTVSVPVLSSTSVVHRARRSSTPPLFTTTPRRAAADSPETRATGAARISGHGVATTRTATARSAPAERPGEPGHGEGQRQEPHGVPVGEPDERRLRVLRLADQADDARVGAVGGGAAARRSNGPPAFTVPLAPGRPAPFGRPGLAGQRGLVQDGDARGHYAVHGNHVAGRHEQHVAGRDLASGTVFQRSPRYRRAVRGARSSSALRSCRARTRRPRLQGPPAGQHDADHRGRQQLADGHRAGQREQRDHVHAEAAAADAVGGGPQRVAQAARRRGQPGRVRDPARPASRASPPRPGQRPSRSAAAPPTGGSATLPRPEYTAPHHASSMRAPDRGSTRAEGARPGDFRHSLLRVFPRPI